MSYSYAYTNQGGPIILATAGREPPHPLSSSPVPLSVGEEIVVPLHWPKLEHWANLMMVR